MCRRSTQGKKHPVKINRQHIAIGLRVHFNKRTSQLADTGIGKHAIDAAHLSHCVGEGGLHGGFIGNVYIPAFGFHAGFGQLRGGFLIIVFIGAPNGNVCTGLRHSHCHAETDAAIAAGHQCDFTCQVKRLIRHVNSSQNLSDYKSLA